LQHHLLGKTEVRALSGKEQKILTLLTY